MSLLILILIFSLLIKSKKNNNLTVTVVIPAYNEETSVAHVVKTALSCKYVNEVIVVDDGSSDKTYDIATSAGANVIRHETNIGKGSALNTGFKNSKGDIIVFVDGDLLNLTKKQIEVMIEPIIKGKTDITKTKFKREAGRVTELTAKPLLDFFFPEINFDQPLSGQFAAKKSILNKMKFEKDYGVDAGIVLDADVLGFRIKEVDIGRIEHEMSNLEDLNKMATEVVRTIVDRAIEYGRITMLDSLGKYIRMGVLGLSLASLGIFGVFFIRFLSPIFWLGLFVVGLVVAIYYIFKLVKRSINTLSYEKSNFQTIKSFFYMHSPMLVSGFILLAMVFTLFGAIEVEDNQISIEPNSGNLIIWQNSENNTTIDVRGPYTIDGAIEGEESIIRISQEALDTLGLTYEDKIILTNESYNFAGPRTGGENNIIRISSNLRNKLSLNIGDVIQDSNLRKQFVGIYALHYSNINMGLVNGVSKYPIENLIIKEGIILQPTKMNNAKLVEVFINNQSIFTTSGIMDNKSSYLVAINNTVVNKIILTNESETVSEFVYGKNIYKIVIRDNANSNVIFADNNTGKFLNFEIFNYDSKLE